MKYKFDFLLFLCYNIIIILKRGLKKMSDKEKFIKMVEELISNIDVSEYPNEMRYFESLKEDKSEGGLTENGQKILSFMQENKEKYNNLFKAKDIGEGLGISSKAVSGSMRKLVKDCYINKVGKEPVIYKLNA